MLKALLLSDFPPIGKGNAFFAGAVVRGADSHRREFVPGEGKDRIALESGTPLPPGPALILGHLDETRASSSNRLEPYLVVGAWISL
ncbi:hypothetical protein [Geothrix sp. 21YS21S-4]|uniref:hypothetical protein n=1 Tax=Geothrix sp. 21YS21S-4 TaxID=3068889 RepID=UPI0027B8DD99|nr:hypothetical protein [Geothrix sp. 21YS21S-4]